MIVMIINLKSNRIQEDHMIHKDKKINEILFMEINRLNKHHKILINLLLKIIIKYFKWYS